MSTTLTHPKVELLALSALSPNPRNARKHSDRQIAQLAANIERFGFLVPVIIDEDGMIAAGHGRWLAARRLGLTDIPAIRAQFLSDTEREAFTLADNRLSELSEWHPELLTENLEILFESGFDIATIGFSAADLDFAIVDEPADTPAKAETVELPDPAETAISRLGDLWEFYGKAHAAPLYRIYCGSSLEAASWEAALGGERTALVFSDPPYNVPINGHVSGTGRHHEFVMGAGELSPAEFTHFLRTAFRNCVRFSANGSVHYHCMDWRHMREVLDAADGVYDDFKQLIVWNKGAGGMGTFYRSQHELIFVFKAGKAKHTNNFGLGESGRYRTNVVDYAGANTFRKGREEDLAAHSTVKPAAMVADFLLDCSNRGDLIADPFLGSGTTLIAAHRTKRRGMGMELDSLYVDTAIKRLTSVSGIEPVLAGDGRSFNEIAAERRQQAEG